MSATRKRNYAREAALESPARKKARAERHKARRLVLATLTKKYGKARAEKILKGKDVNHNKPLSTGGSNSIKNLSLIDPKKNQEKHMFKGKRTTRPKGNSYKKRKSYK